MDEELFWRRMNPARLHALYDAWFAAASSGRRDPAPPQQEPQKGKKSLFAYLSGGE